MSKIRTCCNKYLAPPPVSTKYFKLNSISLLISSNLRNAYVNLIIKPGLLKILQNRFCLLNLTNRWTPSLNILVFIFILSCFESFDYVFRIWENLFNSKFYGCFREHWNICNLQT